MQLLIICLYIQAFYTYRGPGNDISLGPPQLLRRVWVCDKFWSTVKDDSHLWHSTVNLEQYLISWNILISY